MIRVDGTESEALKLYKQLLQLVRLQTSGLITGEHASDDLSDILEEGMDELGRLDERLYKQFLHVATGYYLHAR